MEEKNRNVSSMKHVGIYTKDFKAMVSFYKKVLGLIELANYADSGIHLDIILKRKNVKVNICKLLTPYGEKNGSGDMVELIGLENNGEPDLDRELFTPGISHIAFEVNDIFDIFHSVLCNGGQSVCEPLVVNESGNYMAFCRDIEGNYIELIQRNKN